MQRRYVILCLLASLLGGALSPIVVQMVPAPVAQAQPPATEPARPSLVQRSLSDQTFSTEEQTNIRVYDKANRGVVNITTVSVSREDLFFMFETPSEGSGSGSVLDKNGHILTNFHVIEGARRIDVTLFNGESFPATLKGADPANDIAVLQIEAPATLLEPIPLGDSSGLKVGQKIFAIGNPFGLERTLTIGIISSLNRTLPARNRRTMKSIIQIDAALNRGNSGGPLLNSRAQIIGMNTAIASRTGENTGVGFAIPVNTIRRVVPQLIENGRVIRPDLGITRVFQTDEGLLIARLSPGGPAERAGLRGFRIVRERRQQGRYLFEETRIDQSYADLIVAIDSRAVKTVDDLLSEVEKHQPGDAVTLTVLRDGRRLNMRVTLGADE